MVTPVARALPALRSRRKRSAPPADRPAEHSALRQQVARARGVAALRLALRSRARVCMHRLRASLCRLQPRRRRRRRRTRSSQRAEVAILSGHSAGCRRARASPDSLAAVKRLAAAQAVATAVTAATMALTCPNRPRPRLHRRRGVLPAIGGAPGSPASGRPERRRAIRRSKRR